MSEEFTLEGRRVLDEKTIGGELQRLVEMAGKPPIWICTCNDLRCRHIAEIAKRETFEPNGRSALFMTGVALTVLVLVVAAKAWLG